MRHAAVPFQAGQLRRIHAQFGSGREVWCDCQVAASCSKTLGIEKCEHKLEGWRSRRLPRQAVGLYDRRIGDETAGTSANKLGRAAADGLRQS